MHILILGGTTEANALAGLLAGQASIHTTLSLAGRTRRPRLPPVAHRIGGFGGADGLAGWIREYKVTALIDATHPFAGRMPFNAVEAARITGIPLLALVRPPWQPKSGDRWTIAADHAAAIAALADAPRRVFLTVGRMEIGPYAAAPQHFYLVRSVDPVEDRFLPQAAWLAARGPFTLEGERALMREHGIDMLITKNSGGGAAQAKLAAARERNIPVILIRRPPKPEVENVLTPEAALEWALRLHGVAS